MARDGRLPRTMLRQTGICGVPVVGWDRRVAAVRLGVRPPLVTGLMMVVLSPLVTSRRGDGASVQHRPCDEGDDQAGGRDEAAHGVDRGQPEAAVDGLATQGDERRVTITWDRPDGTTRSVVREIPRFRR
jgi:hypothetical protein